MGKYIIRRLLQMIPIIIGVSLIVFLILQFSPGDPARMIMGMQAEEAEVEKMRETLGLNDPVLVQYVRYMFGFITGDLGESYTTQQTVASMIAVRLPTTLFLNFGSLFLVYLIAIPLGIMLAVKQNSAFDNIFRVVSLIFAAMPSFWMALLMIMLFSVQLGWLPPNGLESPAAAVMPLLASSIAGWMLSSRLVRASMLEVIRQDYIRTARAKGLKYSFVLRRHALKNALLPTVTSVGMAIGTMFGGSFVIESIFGINGMGSMALAALREKDIPVVMANVIITAIIIACANLLTDITYSFIDPRMKTMYSSVKKVKKEA